jgi:DNA-binding LacI/PurR family transcriptional regulator
MQIARILRAEILEGKYLPGSKFPEEAALCSRFGVSKDVVRKSMRILAEEELVRRIRSQGTFVSELRQNTGNQVLLLSCHGPLSLERLRRGVEQGIGDGRYDTVVKLIHPLDIAAERRLLEQLNLSNYAAIVAAPAIAPDNRDNRDWYAGCLQRGIPVIAVDHEYPDIPVDAVYFDEYGSTRRMAEQVLGELPGDARVLVVIREAPHRISDARARALYDAAATWRGKAGSLRIMTCDNPDRQFDFGSDIPSLMKELRESGFAPEGLICDSNIFCFEIFSELRRQGLGGRLKRIGTIGDPGVGDEEFNRITCCHYRLFDDFVEPLREILALRLYSESAAGTPILRKISFKPMTPGEADAYLKAALTPKYHLTN